MCTKIWFTLAQNTGSQQIKRCLINIERDEEILKCMHADTKINESGHDNKYMGRALHIDKSLGEDNEA